MTTTQLTTQLINRPALRYFGGKWRLAKWIMSFFPEHFCYAEPFTGGASVLLQKERVEHEVINDLDGNVVNFFRVLRERPDELIRAIELTPFARDEYRLSIQVAENELERARRFYVRCWQSIGSNADKNGGWRFQRSDNGYSVAKQFTQTDYLWGIVERLRGVQIESDDAIKIIRRYDAPETLFYIDPPYLPETREYSGRYRLEVMPDYHCQLAQVLNTIEGMAIVSGYPSGLYDELFTGWRAERKEVKTNGEAKGLETLWLSPRTTEALANQAAQTEQARLSLGTLPLFAGMEATG